MEESARLGALVSDILDYSKLQSATEAFTLTDFSCAETLGEITARFSLAAEQRGIIIELHCPDGEIRFDRAQLVQVMNNLLDNALRHADAQSIIHVRCESLGHAMRISVENTGETIPAGELPKVWDRYHRAPKQGEAGGLGTGLGLAIVKTILERHGVAFGASSDEGKTTFWFETVVLESEIHDHTNSEPEY